MNRSNIQDYVGRNFYDLPYIANSFEEENESPKKRSSLTVLRTKFFGSEIQKISRKYHSYKIKKTNKKLKNESKDVSLDCFKDSYGHQENCVKSLKKVEEDSESCETPLGVNLDAVVQKLTDYKIGTYISDLKANGNFESSGNVVFSIVVEENPTIVKHYCIKNKQDKNLTPFKIKMAARIVNSIYAENDAIEQTLLMLKNIALLAPKYNLGVYCKMRVGDKKVLFAELDGEETFLEKIQKINEGALGKVYEVNDKILKRAKVKSFGSKEQSEKHLSTDIKEQAYSAIINEFKMLNYIHKAMQSEGQLIGIQDRPLNFVTIRSMSHDGKIKDRAGFLGSKYDECLSVLIEKCSTEQLLSFMFQIFTGLDVLEKLGIYHGDIKPDNMFFKGNDACIADFGGARKIFKIGKRSSFVRILTQHYVCPKDMEKINSIEASCLSAEEKKEKVGTILIKSDMYAACASFLEIALGMSLIDAVKLLHETSEHFCFNLLNPMLKKELKNKKFPSEIVKLLLLGVSSNYENRPKPLDFLYVFKKIEKITV